MPKKRRHQSRTLPNRQCKKPKVVTSLRKNRDSINYDESDCGLLDYFDESEIMGTEESSSESSSETSTNFRKTKKIKEKDNIKINIKNLRKKTIYLSKRSGIIDSDPVCSNLRSKSSKRSRSNTETMFVIEKIVDMKEVDDKRQFLIKWEGFPEIENSWEPEDNIETKDIIKEYLEELEKNKLPETTISNEIITEKEEPIASVVDCESKPIVVNEDEIKHDSCSLSTPVNIEVNESTIESISKAESSADSIPTKIHKKRKSRKRCKRIIIKKSVLQMVKESLDDDAAEDIVTDGKEESRMDSECMEGDKEECDETVAVDAGLASVDSCVDEGGKLRGASMTGAEERLNSSDCVGSTQSNKENEDMDKEEKVNDTANVNESSSDEEDGGEQQPSDIDEQKSESSDEEFNSESRKKSKIKKSNLNVYFPENLPQDVQEIFQVEKILRMRWNRGMRYFYLKWEGFPDTENSWEPESNLECPELIEDFLEELRKSKPKPPPVKKVKRVSAPPAKPLVLETLPVEMKIKEPVIKPKGFPKDREPEVILSSGIINDELNFLIKWKNIDMANLVPAKRANVECPQAVIKFYERNLMWHNNDGSITTNAKERIMIEEETEDQKRSRIAAKKEQQQMQVNGTPRKKGRPCSKSMNPSLLQSRKLTSGASRMLNIINNFQNKKVQPTIVRRPSDTSEQIFEPVACTQPGAVPGQIDHASVTSGHGATVRSDCDQYDHSDTVNSARNQYAPIEVPAMTTAEVGGPTEPWQVSITNVTGQSALLHALVNASHASVNPSHASVNASHASVNASHASVNQSHAPNPYDIPNDTNIKANLINVLKTVYQQRDTIKSPKPIGRPRKQCKVQKKSVTDSIYDSIDLTDDIGSPCDGVTRQYESREMPCAPSPASYDFGRSSLQVHQSPVIRDGGDHKPQLQLYHNASSTPPGNGTALLSPLHQYQQSNFNRPAPVTQSPSLAIGLTPRSTVNTYLHRPSTNATNNTTLNISNISLQSPIPSLSLKQQLQHNIAANLGRHITVTPAAASNNGLVHYQQMASSPDTSRPQPQSPLNQSMLSPFQLSAQYRPSPQYLSTNNSLQQYQSTLTNDQLMSPQQQQQQQQRIAHSTQNQAILYHNQYPPIQYQYIINGNNFQQAANDPSNGAAAATNVVANTFTMPTNQGQMFYQPPGNLSSSSSSSSLRSIMPRKPDYPTQNNQLPVMNSPQQTQLQTQQNNQLLINSYLNLGAYL